MNLTDETTNTFTEPTLFQTSEGVTHEDNDVTPRTPVRNKARTYENPDPQFLKNEHERTLCSPSDDNEAFGQGSFKLSAKVSEVKEESPNEIVLKENLKLEERNKKVEQHCQEDGNPSSMQTQENPDPQFLKIEHERTLCSPFGDNEAFGQGSFKLSSKVSEVEKESPEENVFKENLVERNKILKQHCQEDGNPPSIQTQENHDHKILENMSEENRLLTDKIPMKSEHERTVCSPSDADEAMRRKENKLSSKELLRSNTLKDEELRDLRTERKQNEEKYEELLRSNTLKDEELKTERKQNEVKSAIIESLKTKSDKECKKLKKTVGVLERENERLEEEARDEFEEGKAQMKITEKVECEKTRLEEECEKLKKTVGVLEREKERLEEELLRPKTLKDEELKTERKQTEEKYEGKGREKKLETENKELKDENTKINNELKELKKEWERLMNCQVCLDKEKKILLLPCGHFCVCQECVLRCERKCPICRKEITDHVKAFN